MKAALHPWKLDVPAALAALVAGGLGLGLNAFPLSIGSDLHLIFGPIFPLIIALTFGPLYGMVAALLAGLATVWLWGHGLALPFLAAQAFVVGWCVRRWKWRALFADAVFWVGISPLLYFLHVRSGVYPDGLGPAVAFKYVVNGLLCTTLADSSLGWPAFGRLLARYGARLPENTMAARLTRVLTLVAVVPACALSAWYAHAASNQQEQEVRAELTTQTRFVANVLSDKLLVARQDVIILANRLSEMPDDPAAVARRLQRYHQHAFLFETLLVADTAGKVIASSPVVSEPQLNVAGHPYLQAALSGQNVVISDGLHCPVPAGKDPCIAFAAPIRLPDGSVRGVVEGRMTTTQLSRLLSGSVAHRGEPFHLVVLDWQSQVLATNRPDLFPLLAKTRLSDIRAYDRALWLPIPASGKEARFWVWQEREPETGWRCYALVPFAVVHQRAATVFIPFLLAIPFVLFVVAWASGVTVRRVMRPLDELTATARVLATDPERAPDILPDSPNGQTLPATQLPAEIAHLTEAFHAMARQVGKTMSYLRATNIELEIARQRLEDARDNLERELAARTAEIERREEARLRSQKLELLGHLTGGIAHNFNNLLTVILSYSSLELSRRAPDDPACKGLQSIRRAAERGRDLVKQLMAYSRASEASAALCFPLHDALRTVQGMVERLFNEEVELTTNFAAGEVFVYAIPQELEQVFLNLLVNARDAMPNGGTISLETTLVADTAAEAGGVVFPAGSRLEDFLAAQPVVRISVRDTGTGIPPEVMARLCEPFFTTKEQHKGTGLGLSTALGTITSAGGLLRVESEVGKGTAFHVYLPVANQPAAGVPASGSQRLSFLKPSAQARRVLVVEDDPDVRATVEAALLAGGFAVVEARDGQAAWNIIQQQAGRFDLVVTDVRMPNVNGVQLASSIWETYPDLPVLFISGYADRDDTRQSFAFRDNLIYKPFTAAEIVEKVKSMMDRNAAEYVTRETE
ncbi:response regulator [Chloracidobacterium aggregatum]|uniref:response regulator n=1 Tax=Chloracidobacterium aggregatum TaxID=2851959 RepID=UPI001B8ABC87|nr:response regulator [Chloracidobacterium aggregatum]QUV86129.1 response regulator [Chloracidobacterium sp. 2]QUV89425.1 response regulator [Chloracidobacterium sp. S]QUV98254.1 response regulator [Chloracidobacterium sp. E]